ncbi:MAG: arylamine N-acetyltransferase [Ferruginibacter sp.]
MVKAKPSLEYLQKLITAYSTTVPWESFSRILRKDKLIEPEKCIRLEFEFWNDAITYGTGGTCYESNFAFNFLLKSLGFETYLTINEIKDKSSLHSAIIVSIDSTKFIVDIGYPLYAPIPLNKKKAVFVKQNKIEYVSTYLSEDRYLIENYPHPKPYLYHLTDKPIGIKDYLQICVDDYGEKGLFLDRMIIRKVKQGIPTRFDSEDLPFNIHQLQNGLKIKQYLDIENIIVTLSEFYNININIIKQVFKLQAKLRPALGFIQVGQDKHR